MSYEKKLLKKKIEELNNFYSEKLKLSDDIQNFISAEITASIREIVGAVNRIISFSKVYKKMPNLSETKIVLKDLLNRINKEDASLIISAA